MNNIKHPAPYNAKLMPLFADIIARYSMQHILDPFAGIGRIFMLREYLPALCISALELEPEWASQHPETIVGDALHLPYTDASFDAICTSITYGNRLADSHTARDASERITYTHCLGRKLSPTNSGGMQWGQTYRDFHRAAWQEAKRVLADPGYIILNIKDHIRGGKLQSVTTWHSETICNLGFALLETHTLPLRGMGYGANGKIRVPYESVLVFRQ